LILTLSDKYEDLNWSGIQNSDLLKSILIKLRTRTARTSFKWVKGHEDNYGNNRADALANAGRENDSLMRTDEEKWIDDHPALQDGARLQALDARHTYDALIRRHMKRITPILHQEKLDKAKDKVEEATGLRPTNEKLLKGFRTLGVPLRLKDHMRNMLIGKIKCGSYWSKIPGYTDRAYCSFCKKKKAVEITESEQHMWLDCENNGQSLAWETARKIWIKTTDRTWPTISMGLIRGAAALSFEYDYSKDSERLRILISMTIWAIWKSRNKNSINDQDVTTNETREALKDLIQDLIRKGWNATRFLEGSRRMIHQRALQSLWVL